MWKYLRGLLLLVALALVSCSCISISSRREAAIASHEYMTSYRIITLCKDGFHGGSGTAISPQHILTAKHVVHCAEGTPEEYPALTIVVGDWERNFTQVKISKVSVKHDVAVLVASEPFAFRRFAIIHDKIPFIGERVCSIAGDSHAYMLRKCGEATPKQGYYLITTVYCVPGNSGSALRDEEGHIIGVNVRASWEVAREHYMNTIPIGYVLDELIVGVVEKTL